MDSVGQFSVFIQCVVCGYCAGLLYEVFALFRLLFGCQKRENIIGILLDVAFFGAFAVGAIYLSYLRNFPSLRVYMWIGYALGGVLYSKTLRRILAFLEKVCYNKLVKVAKKAKTKKKLLKERENL